jgi:hypothetical protein
LQEEVELYVSMPPPPRPETKRLRGKATKGRPQLPLMKRRETWRTSSRVMVMTRETLLKHLLSRYSRAGVPAGRSKRPAGDWGSALSHPLNMPRNTMQKHVVKKILASTSSLLDVSVSKLVLE